ncbi:Glutamate decarboxylase 2 [Mycoemilia scoparia]|uniref:Glutamate decarboxylase 2 n=1 Tax=Mycoemilia scoparia TaxID=417184 RepID=A0A9W8A1N1_9FUNG|nr:Glutamate decarboxylase 2 [Mycoemilia scoparia]
MPSALGDIEKATGISQSVASDPGYCELKELEALLTKVTDRVIKYVQECRESGGQAGPIPDPSVLSQMTNTHTPTGYGNGADGVLGDVDLILKNSIKTWNQGFVHKLYSSTNPIGVISELVLGAINNNAHVYSACPINSVVEIEMAKRLGECIGWDPSECGGLTCPGGSSSNTLALIAARNFHFPGIKENGLVGSGSEGLGGIPLVFTSSHAHYSIEKAAMAAGVGLSCVVKVPCNSNGSMDPHALDLLLTLAKRQGYKPFFVNATAGTTVLGAFDPLDTIADVCERHGVWMHVDGSLGGPILFFPPPDSNIDDSSLTPLVVGSLDSLRAGLRRAESVSLNPHKLLGVPLQCSYLLVRRGMPWLKQQVSLKASYLFHDDFADYDIGDASLGCGRRPDALKLWLAWRYYGDRGFSQRIERALHLSSLLAEKATSRKPILHVLKTVPFSTSVSLWYVPPGLRHLSHNELMKSQDLDAATKKIHRMLLQRGKVLVDYSTAVEHEEINNLALDAQNPKGCNDVRKIDIRPVMRHLPSFLRIPLNSPHMEESFIDEIVEEIEEVGDILFK